MADSTEELNHEPEKVEASDEVIPILDGVGTNEGLEETSESATTESAGDINSEDKEKVKEEEAPEENMECDDDEDDDETEGDEYLEITGENTFSDVLEEEASMDGDNDKEIHEGDGEHDDMKDDAEEEEEEEELEGSFAQSNQDPNVMPQVNVAVLAQRKWQVKVYPLKPADFVSGQISRIFKHARESLLYLLSPGKNARGKGEMYISSVNQAILCVHSLMRLEYFHPEVNVEVIRKNDEGAVEEKAYLRFDSKLTQLLTTRPYKRAPGGRKKDRLIGSVFVKNLPPGTTKDTLRVMFPFAQEINYNPEKFKDCTARLVLHCRKHVIPCLKAFAKVELGGNILELHPLTKRQRTRTDDDDVPPPKQRKQSEEPKTPNVKPQPKQSTNVKKEVPKKKPETSRDNSVKKASNDRKDHKPGQFKKPEQRDPPTRKDHRFDNRSTHRPKSGTNNKDGASPSVRGNYRGGKTIPSRTFTPRQNQNRSVGSFTPRNERSPRDFKPAARRFTVTNNRGTYPRGSSSNNRGRSVQTSTSRSSYSSGLGVGSSGMAASDASLAFNTEATKEMVLLQNQLSMAIKNQLAMLNQTQMAVEQAKRVATSSVVGSDVQSNVSSRSSPKGLGIGSRSVDQYRPAASVDGSMDRYGNRNQPRAKRRDANIGSYDKRVIGGGYRDSGDDWEREMPQSQLHDPYAQSQTQDYGYQRERSFGSSSRSSYNQDNMYSGYY